MSADGTTVDVLLRGGTVFDGLGAPGVVADVAIVGDRVVSIEPGLRVSARRVIDVDGLAVAPGFIDPHTHSDVVPFMADPQPFKLRQGVTTEIVGNCGNSAAPLVDETAVDLHRPISSTVVAGVTGRPRSFAEYLDDIEAAGPTNHVASLVGHHTLRMSANGMTAELAEGALERMCELAADAFAAGAVGLSSGLIYAPGVYAEPGELVALARVAARWHRPYATHMRDEGFRVHDALEETLDVARRGGVRVQVSHVKVAGLPNHGRSGEYLDILAAARREGIDVLGDAYPYTTGETFLGALLPSALHEGGPGELVPRLRDLSRREEWRQRAEAGRDGTPASGAWHQTTPAGIMVSMHLDASLPGRTIEQIAADRGCSPWDALCDIVADDPASMMVFELQSQDDMRAFLADPLVAIGSDNSVPVRLAHQRGWGCFPTVLGRYVREEGVLELAEAIRKMTSLTARQFGLAGRGILAPGSIADVVVFDPETIGHPGTPLTPSVRPTGVPYVLLAGHIAIDGGEFDGGRNGRVLRAGQAERAPRVGAEKGTRG